MTSWHIAQLNVARAMFPLDDPRIAEFVTRLDEINALADASPGFVWRLQSEAGNATDIQATDDPQLIVNLSVWQSVGALFDFVYRTAHREVMAKRRQWFERPTAAYQVLWWVPDGHEPSVDEAIARLDHINAHGPTGHAFTFKQVFPPPGQPGKPDDLKPDPLCVGWG